MKLLEGILIFFLLGMTLPVHASDQQVQADLLLVKISAALKDNRTSEALSACATLEKLGVSLAKPLPEVFYYYYIETLHRSGAKESLLSRVYAYQKTYGKDGPHDAQVTAIFRELQREAMSAGNVDADAAVIAWKEANRLRQEAVHEQIIGLLRACQSEAITLEGGEAELSVAYDEINAQSESLLARKAALDQRTITINRAEPGTPEEQKQLRLDFNRDSQAYNEAVRDFNNARELHAARVEGQSRRLQSYTDRCADLSISKYDLEAVCGKSTDWFCRNFE